MDRLASFQGKTEITRIKSVLRNIIYYKNLLWNPNTELSFSEVSELPIVMKI